MKKTTSLTIICVFLFSLLAPLHAQQPQPSPAPSQPLQQPPPAPQDDEEEVVRITTNLVQMDVVVVDKKGNQVTDLRAEDFEVYEDKRPQKITNFSYVLNETTPRPATTTTAAGPAAPARGGADKLATPEPPRRLRPEQVRRTMALVVDDLGLSFESTAIARNALRKFVNEQMQPNDLVAIIRTSAGVGALQQFTSDKRQLNAVIDRVKWYMSGRGGISAFAPIEGGAPAAALAGGGADENRMRGTLGDPGEALEDFREEIFAVGTLGALNFVVRGMRELPGRKSVILLSEGFSLFTVDRGRGSSDRVLQAVRRLTDLANRASVVVYSIDTRGLVYTGLTAADNVGELSNERIDEMVRARSDRLFDTQSGLNYLSQQTGGFLVRNNNDIAKAIAKVGEDQKGYYLIGYRPESTTYDRRYHTYAVKVKRPGLKVRTRAGFYGIRDEETRPVRRTREQQLMAALTSPFASSAVRLRLTTIFSNNAQEGSFMRSLVHIDANDLKFTREPDGKYQATLDVVGLTFGDNGRVVDSRVQSGKLSMNEETYRKVEREGLIYSLNVPIKKAGAYQLRMAVRDAATEQTGSASQFIEVPDLKKNRLVLSGLVLNGIRSEGPRKAGKASAAATSAQEGGDNQPAEGALNEQETLASPAVRRFGQSSSLAFGYAIYNARLDKTTNLPQLTTQTRIFRDGQPVFTGKEQPVDVTQYPDLKRINTGARLQLGSGLTPGEYVLQVVVTDMLAKPKDKHRNATQWTDFEIVK